MSGPRRFDSLNGWSWWWTEQRGPARIERRVEWVIGAGRWISAQRVDGGGWTEQPMPAWEPPVDEEQAEQMVIDYHADREMS